jgi:hypothetical protein
VSPSSERAHRGGGGGGGPPRKNHPPSEDTSSSDEEESLSPSSLSSPSSSSSSSNGRRFFDVTVESSTFLSAYLRLFSVEVIRVAAEKNLFCYKCQHCSLYGVIGDPPDEARTTIQWRGVTLELPVVTGNNYVSIARCCCELSVSVATGTDDIIFCSSLLSSRVTDDNAVRRYYNT